MKRNTGRVVGALVLAAGSLGAIGAVLIKKRASRRSRIANDVWARPGMSVTFRAELMPGHNRARRTFKVKELLASGRVLLHETGGEHTETEFEHIERNLAYQE
ncbi:MAG TPA: hypothetical protein VGN86_03185 [Pyrinomonadaceae bacterium]|nr:hypothetical protein [Pyrinomonadaceae bacterium]